MKKAKSNRGAQVCPVLPIALRIGELWDAHAGAEEREFNQSPADASEQIGLLRIAVEETASFERARSVAGALFQVGLAEDTAVHLRELVPSEEKTVKKTFDKLIRLLDSVALLLRDECPAEDYQAVKDVLAVYLAIDRPEFNALFQWRDDIPELAEEYRRSKKAAPAAV
jgi:hypothetical protein